RGLRRALPLKVGGLYQPSEQMKSEFRHKHGKKKLVSSVNLPAHSCPNHISTGCNSENNT
ncbi:MAG TPA: hypothetical protein PK002_06620, partial [Cellvibrio sp.]|nr:hypothetical protein [Cellvibrio sp.]